MFKQLIIASLAIASVAATSAQAQDTQSVTVSLAGIDTHSPSGARIMLQRIKVAARAVCGPAPSTAMDRHLQYDPCVDSVTQRTVDGLANPYLTALLGKERPGVRRAQLASAK